eukprot:5907563-Pleurochrysis_carterae.AAC.2
MASCMSADHLLAYVSRVFSGGGLILLLGTRGSGKNALAKVTHPKHVYVFRLSTAAEIGLGVESGIWLCLCWDQRQNRQRIDRASRDVEARACISVVLILPDAASVGDVGITE